MNADPSFEQALLDFTQLIVPLSMDIGAPVASSTASNLIAALKSLALLIGLNLLTLVVVSYLGKILLSTLDSIVTRFVFGLTWSGLLIRRHIMRNLRRRLLSHGAKKKVRRKTRIIEDDASFKSWEQIANGTVFRCFGGELTNEVRQALNILGAHPFSTESEIRKAYLNLMKQHHPDHYMQASPGEFKRAQVATVQIREAYDKITRQFCQVQ